MVGLVLVQVVSVHDYSATSVEKWRTFAIYRTYKQRSIVVWHRKAMTIPLIWARNQHFLSHPVKRSRIPSIIWQHLLRLTPSPGKTGLENCSKIENLRCRRSPVARISRERIPVWSLQGNAVDHIPMTWPNRHSSIHELPKATTLGEVSTVEEASASPKVTITETIHDPHHHPYPPD